MFENVADLLTKEFNKQINLFISQVSEKYSISKEELESLLDTSTDGEVEVKVKVKKDSPAKVAKKTVENVHEGKTCQHKMTSGKKKGDLCGEKVHPESKTGVFCKTHMKNELNNKFLNTEESSEPKEEPVKIEKKKVEKKDADKPLINNTENIKQLIQERTSNLTIKKNKQWNHYEHPETHLVLDQNTQEVYARLDIETGKLSELTPDDINLAKTVGFKKIRIPENLPSSINGSKKNEELYDSEDDYSDVEEDEEEEEDM